MHCLSASLYKEHDEVERNCQLTNCKLEVESNQMQHIIGACIRQHHGILMCCIDIDTADVLACNGAWPVNWSQSNIVKMFVMPEHLQDRLKCSAEHQMVLPWRMNKLDC